MEKSELEKILAKQNVEVVLHNLNLKMNSPPLKGDIHEKESLKSGIGNWHAIFLRAKEKQGDLFEDYKKSHSTYYQSTVKAILRAINDYGYGLGY